MRHVFPGRKLPEHLKVPWGITSAMVIYLLAWVILPVVIVVALKVLSPVLPHAQEFLSKIISGDMTASFILTITVALGGLAFVAMWLQHYEVSWETVGWRKFDLFKAAGYLLLIFLLFIVAAGLLLQLVSMLDPSFNADEPQTNELLQGAHTNRTLALIGLVLIPPIIEETVFRGFIFPALAKNWGFWGGAIASSVLFGLAHLQANVGIYTFVLGLLLCFMYARLKSIFPGMILHMINNYLAFLALVHK